MAKDNRQRYCNCHAPDPKRGYCQNCGENAWPEATRYEDLRAKFDAEMRDRIDHPLKHMARRDIAQELQHCIDDTNVGQPNRYASVNLLERAITRIRELEADRDSWAEQASQRVADWEREHELRIAAERRVGELERASQAGGGEADLRDALRDYETMRDTVGGCTDGGCLVKKPTGMHTNGGCKCHKDPLKATRMMWAGSKLFDAARASLDGRREG
ncbi:hypothetical protein QTN24_15380 [Cupriavidus sp. SZY C1]|uniref:hypothetical protein n=1 Tax=Cupriavidus sp. SZY C1 TaxID=3055037 RepID=UPI0028BA3A65|nr:hypothetical protein [Cupriavidus sp. SZY C1]MDT6962881.1 hypothetical protein [Cupriavidus sp. SZY C1]